MSGKEVEKQERRMADQPRNSPKNTANPLNTGEKIRPNTTKLFRSLIYIVFIFLRPSRLSAILSLSRQGGQRDR